MKNYDTIIVGSGLFGAVFAHERTKVGKKCLVLEKRNHIAGNVYTERIDGIDVHRYGPHIFHTDKREIWDYVNSFTPFRPYVQATIANYKGELYNLPFNMHTFYQMWGVQTPEEARKKLEEQRAEYASIVPKNLEEQALKLVGRDIYEKLIKGYTEKQWNRPCTELPIFIIRRLPVRFTFDNNYFNDMFQGIPMEGYTKLVEEMLQGVEVKLGVDFLENRAHWEQQAEQIVFTGRVDQYFDEKFGKLEYRSLRFEEERLEVENYQGAAVMNYTAADVPYTRITEHKHFTKVESSCTIISREFPQDWKEGLESYYPVNDKKNDALYAQYAEAAKALPNVIFGGRLGTYCYYNMDQIVEKALEAAAKG